VAGGEPLDAIDLDRGGLIQVRQIRYRLLVDLFVQDGAALLRRQGIEFVDELRGISDG
jgi:hypothetical protein